jgi:DNA-binding transcriptional MerR regulator
VVSRAHLSIGEVLSLLQVEFPDVTISKIRFLESQGLVDPERTPSGYRKFYEADIDRLRWVLRQQRDAFLPLKVIKGRLDDQPEAAGDERADGLLVPDLDEELDADKMDDADLADEDPADEDVPRGDVPPEESTGPVDVDVTAPQAGGPKAPAENLLAGREAQLFDAGPPYSNHAEPVGPEDRPALHRRSPVGRSATRAIGARPVIRHNQRRDSALAAREERPSGAQQADNARGGRMEPAGDARPGADPHELTLDELLEEAGVQVETVRELEGFGLITPKGVGGAPYYTRDAVTVARLASAFARHGVEARHLRAYKGAAEREAGLVEQVIMPLIRQRNPEARRAAAQAVEELSHLGGELRTALLRAALADLH